MEEACLKAGYEVAGVVAKNQNKIVDLALPFRLSGLPNNATIELSISDKPKNQSVELAIQVGHLWLQEETFSYPTIEGK